LPKSGIVFVFLSVYNFSNKDALVPEESAILKEMLESNDFVSNFAGVVLLAINNCNQKDF